ncbi:MAG: hypothetical protein MUC48_07540 [Leptolyngbya sp. Prado105]|nr:hypothetical protein [Leptolyngbya sp. Prado105]
MDSQIVVSVAAIAIAFLVVRLVLRMFQVGTGLILTIVAIVLVLQYGFGISPKAIWLEMSHLPQELAQFVKNFNA